jgi:hypothetical protein
MGLSRVVPSRVMPSEGQVDFGWGVGIVAGFGGVPLQVTVGVIVAGGLLSSWACGSSGGWWGGGGEPLLAAWEGGDGDPAAGERHGPVGLESAGPAAVVHGVVMRQA